MVNIRTYTAGNYVLELDGTMAGFLRSVDGGATYAEVIEEATGVDRMPRKHIGAPRVEDFLLEVGMPPPAPLAAWLAASWSGKSERKSGAVVSLDFNFKPFARREFVDALLTEVGFPACDGTSKSAAAMGLRLSPETARDTKPGTAPVAASKAQKTWIPANFRLDIDGLECQRVSKIDAFTVKQQVTEESVGAMRDFEKLPGRIEFPNLRITFSTADAQTWATWFEGFVVKGQSEPENEKSGTITFLAPDAIGELGRVKLFNLGIFRLGRSKADPGTEQVARMVADLYCERMEFELGKAAG